MNASFGRPSQGFGGLFKPELGDGALRKDAGSCRFNNSDRSFPTLSEALQMTVA